MSEANHWDPHNGAWWRSRFRSMESFKKRKKVNLLTGLPPNVAYLTIRDVCEHEGVKQKVVRYALAKGHLKAARRQSGRAGVLIHPDEYARWSAERKQKKETAQ